MRRRSLRAECWWQPLWYPMNRGPSGNTASASRVCREYNLAMASPEKDLHEPTGAPTRVRQPGWLALLFVLAIAFLIIGGMLLGMMQAPVFPRKLVAVAWTCFAAGLVLTGVAWAARRR